MELFGTGVAAALATSLAIQQVVEFMDAIVFRSDETRLSQWRQLTVRVMSVLSGFVAAAACTGCGALTIGVPDDSLRFLIVGFGLAGGAEGANSLLKLAKYVKESKKAQAAISQDRLRGEIELHAIQRK